MKILKISNKTKNAEAFTLVELLIVIAVIAILATIAIPTFAGYRSRGFDTAAISDLKAAAIAQEAYHVDNEIYSLNLADLQVLPYGLSLSTGVALNIMAADTAGYTMTAVHSTSGRVFTLTGPGGLINP